MPEGDTIARAARRLGLALDGAVLSSPIDAPRWAGRLPAEGETILGVRSVGKHLEMRFSGGLLLRTHMRMTGSWHLYRPGERWRRPRRELRVAVRTSAWEAVCFSAPDVEFVVDPGTRPDGSCLPSEATAYLGPDLARADADLEVCVERFDVLDPSTTLAEALLDQRVCCGVGNVFKSEVCWALRLDPFAPVGELDEATRRAAVQVAADQIRANLTTSRRTTVPGGLAVYGRSDRACRRCRTPVRSLVHGRHARRTYWCPGCQTATSVQSSVQ